MQKNSTVSLNGRGGDPSSLDLITATSGINNESLAAEILLKKNNERLNSFQSSIWTDIKSIFTTVSKTSSFKPTYWLIAASFLILIVNVIGEVRMNEWQGSFFRAVEHRNLSEIGTQSLLFIGLILFLLCFVVAQYYLVDIFKLRLRTVLTKGLLDQWMKPGRVYKMNLQAGDNLNPDQRLQEDVKLLCDNTGDLSLGFAKALFMLVSFISVLWVMSRGITLPWNGHSIQVPGYMVWFAMAYAAVGTIMAARAGSPLINLNDTRYSREANFRYSLVRVSDNAESIAFHNGEPGERKIIDSRFKDVLSTMKSLALANAKLSYIAWGHGWMVVLIPVLVALPGYLQGKLDFGGLMMVVGAFNQVQTSLRWFVATYSNIADWRALIHRVAVFCEALESADRLENTEKQILVSYDSIENLVFEKASVQLINGETVIERATATIETGERVMLKGSSGSGKSTLMRAIGGLWPWGSGSIRLPKKESISFLPQKPYLPLASLAAALVYPNSVSDYKEEDLHKSLKRVNLEELITCLNEEARWDKVLSLGQQQRLAFARLLLTKPKWIFLDEATSALDDENEENVMSVFEKELAGSTIVSVGHRSTLEKYHNRVLELKTHADHSKAAQKGSILTEYNMVCDEDRRPHMTYDELSSQVMMA